MFRYIGFSWNPAQTATSACARRLDQAIAHTAAWQCVLSIPGLRVYMIGSRPRANGAYLLPFARGVVLGRLFRRGEAHSASRDVDLTPSEADRILATEGQALVNDYWGRYVAIFTSERHGPRLLRDPSGALPCWLSHVEGVAVFYSWLEDFIHFTPHRPVPLVDWSAVLASFAIGRLGGRDSALEGVAQVLPGQRTSLNDVAAKPASLWSIVARARHRLEDVPDIAAEQLRRVVYDCVGAWSSCHDAILLRLSGGVDSAILLGSLTPPAATARVTCLNYHSPGSDSDERAYARLAATKAGVALIERERDAAFRLDDVLDASRTPAPESYVGRMETGAIDAQVADAHRATAMFTGAGGDQLFFQIRCTWPAADYLSVHGPGRGFLRAAIDAARLGQVSLWQSMWSALADRHHRTRPFDGIGQFFTLARPEALADLRPERFVHPDLAGATDLPIGKFHQVLQLINTYGYYDPYMREAAPELVNPLLSQPLIEHCLATPTWVLAHGGRGRALARHAFARELPREIALRQSKGGVEEHIAAVLHGNLPFARALLLDGQLVQRGLVDRAKLEAALAGRLSALGGYLGEIHHYIGIEAWLRRFADARGA